MTARGKEGRFANLKALRDRRQDEEADTEVALPNTEDMPFSETGGGGEEASQAPFAVQAAIVTDSAPAPKAQAKRGRPAGRRSDPDYTQISAYIPLDLLLDVQDELSQEQREKRQRTPRPVSDLVEDLLDDWLKKRRNKKTKAQNVK